MGTPQPKSASGRAMTLTFDLWAWTPFQ